MAALTLAQLAQPGETPLDDAYRHALEQLTPVAVASGDSTVLAHDRGVTELVRRHAALRGELAVAQRRRVALAAEAQAWADIESAELTQEGRARLAERVRRTEEEQAAVAAEVGRLCHTLSGLLSELRGRIGGKIDTLLAAETACAALGARAPATLCARSAETRGALSGLLEAVGREAVKLEVSCGAER